MEWRVFFAGGCGHEVEHQRPTVGRLSRRVRASGRGHADLASDLWRAASGRGAVGPLLAQLEDGVSLDSDGEGEAEDPVEDKAEHEVEDKAEGEAEDKGEADSDHEAS